MQRTKEALSRISSVDDRPKFPISWSPARVQSLREMASKTVALRSPLDDRLAAAILLCVEGEFQTAQDSIAALIGDNLDLIVRDGETFITTIFALYVSQKFELLSTLFYDRFGFNGELNIDVEENGPDVGRVRWESSKTGLHRFVFDAKSYRYDKTREDILAFYWSFPMYSNFSFNSYCEHGQIVINQMDIGYTPGLAWSENRPDYFLVPDCIFIPTRGYEHVREAINKNLIPWEDRKEKAFWRGGTTGIPKQPGVWRSLERIQLCEIGRRYDSLGFVDIGLSSIIQISDPAAVEEIKASGYLRSFVPWAEWGQFKYQIDIDGNSSPWSNLFQRLLTGSPVLKIESSRALNQWYYDELKPWVNYVPIAPDMSDLIDKIQWLRKNDSFAKAVGQSGRALANNLTYERELARSAQTIARCFRYFRGEATRPGPFGREPAF